MNDKDYLIRLGFKIKILRKLRNLSQDEIVNSLDIDKSYYSKVERGLTNPTVIYLRNLAKILDTTLSELVDLNINLQ